MATTQFSATISVDTKARLDEIARVTGRTRQSIVEDAILHEAMALEEIPEEYLVPAKIVLTRESAREVLARIDNPRPPTAAMRRGLQTLATLKK